MATHDFPHVLTIPGREGRDVQVRDQRVRRLQRSLGLPLPLPRVLPGRMRGRTPVPGKVSGRLGAVARTPGGQAAGQEGRVFSSEIVNIFEKNTHVNKMQQKGPKFSYFFKSLFYCLAFFWGGEGDALSGLFFTFSTWQPCCR